MSLSRRQFVGRGVAVGAACWVAPTIVSVPVAWASDIGSRPPKSPPKETVSQPQMGGPLPDALPAQLAYTGPNVERDAQLGVAALTTGAVLVALNRPEKRAMQ